MSRRSVEAWSRFEDVEVGRRGALKALAGGGLALGGAKAADNVLVGYGVLTGTNLVEQDLAAQVRARFGPSKYSTSIAGARIDYADGRLSVRAEGRVEWLPVAPRATERAESLDDEFGLGGRFAGLARDLVAVDAGTQRFEFATVDEFAERVSAAAEAGRTRPETVGALRGARFEAADPALVREFADADPADPLALVSGLKAGFREHSSYDFLRYAAGSVEDNVLFGAGDLRAPFRSPTSLEAILEGRNSGLFCYDFAFRSIEAFHAVPARDQTVPVMGAVVTDARHKHVYTGLATVVREGGGGGDGDSGEGDLVVPMTFLDYMHSTQYDDLRLRGVLGEGVNAYDRRHRTDDVYWNRYSIW